MIATLPAGNYTAVLRGANSSTGIAVVEGYDLTQATGKIGNISTRGFAQTGDGAMIGGFLVGNQTTKMVVRAIGPSLAPFGVPTPLADPTVELRNANGDLLDSNNNWKVRDSDGTSQQPPLRRLASNQRTTWNPRWWRRFRLEITPASSGGRVMGRGTQWWKHTICSSDQKSKVAASRRSREATIRRAAVGSL
jgi:hypothetical protein